MFAGRVIAALVLVFGLAVASARADEPVRVRVGDHPGFGRIVLDFGSQVPFRLVREGDRVTLNFTTTATIGTPSSTPRNVLGFVPGAAQVEIRVKPGTRVQTHRVASGLAIDVLDAPAAVPNPAPPPSAKPPPVTASKAPARPLQTLSQVPPSSSELLHPAPTPAPAAPAVPVAASSPAPETMPAAASPQLEATAQVAQGGGPGRMTASDEPPRARSAQEPHLPSAGRAPGAPAGPVATAPGSTPLALVASAGADGSLRLPFASTTGAAAFRRGSLALLIFDERRPIDLAGVRGDPVFGAAAVQLLPEATVVRLPLAPGATLTLSRTAEGWTVTPVSAARYAASDPSASQVPVPRIAAIATTLTDRRLNLAMRAPGRVLNVADPDTGGVLLVATQRQPGQGTPVPHRTSEFVLLPTWQGVAVEPLSDHIFLRNDKDGFVLGSEPSGLALVAPPVGDQDYAAAGRMTRRYDIPPFSPEGLQRRLQADVEAAAAAPPLARAGARRQAAEAMIALGLGPEAQSVLRLAAAEDGRELANPNSEGLGAIAALLAGHVAEADGITDPRLDGTDEIGLWRAVREAMLEEGSPTAAPVFAATLPLLLSYPPSLRGRLLPLAVETMALAGVDGAGTALARMPDDPRLQLARAIWLQMKGDRDGALTLFDALTGGADRLTRLRAATRATELRLAAGMIDARQAADALERQLYCWRGDGREIALRLRIAALRQQAGEWRPALTLLRETETLDADARPAVHRRLVETFAALLADHNPHNMAPLDLVTLADENADLVPDSDASVALAERLADRLLALDLPRRADAVLSKLVGATMGDVRVSFGTRLAALRLREGDPAGALSALADTDLDGLPADVAQKRAIVRAGALARQGDPGRAARILAEIGSDEAAALRATVLEDAHDWPAAEQALTDYAARTVPPAGALDQGQKRTLLRLAGATAQAGDAAVLAALGQREGKRMEGGPLGDMFRLLTAGPVQGGTDLPRAAREVALARSFTADIKAVGSPEAPR